ncbi:ligand-gated ion channel [Phenylobacterium ferrooxidans]|uniref:Uncharacterized protein n=1 Tax=Phenylobacterium ferrooxidans TaxID=2982689 RepID=A0ABW6CT54_9CAUL
MKFPHRALALAILAILGLLMLAAAPVRALAAPTPAITCRLGAWFVSVHDINAAEGTFKADFWMWSVCPERELNPLESLEFLNAAETEEGLDATLQRGGKWWSTRKISGVFRQDFDLQNYPFDRQALEILVEEAVLDERSLRYVADSRNSGLDPGVKAPGWRLTGFRNTAGVAMHPTTFGDPSLPDGASYYATLRMEIVANRARLGNFVKATFVLYIAAILGLMCLALDVVDSELFLGRLAALGTGVFAVVLSFLSLEQLIGPHEGLYLLDQLHVVVLALIMLATGWSVLAFRLGNGPVDADRVRTWDARVSLGIVAAFVAANAILIGLAMVQG